MSECIDRTRRHMLKLAALGGAGVTLQKFVPYATSVAMAKDVAPSIILKNGKITTLNEARREVSAIAMAHGRVLATGSDEVVMKLATNDTHVIDLNKRRVIPGLHDSHIHLLQGGVSYNMELRWEGVPSVAIALEMLRYQAQRTPAPQWLRVVGGWSEFQFKERRMPTLSEVNKVAPDTPVLILHLYNHALLNQAALRALGIGKDTPNPLGGKITRDRQGNPIGLFVNQSLAQTLYATFATATMLPEEYRYSSMRHYMREMNRLGITSVIDASGQPYDMETHRLMQRLHDAGEMTVRIAHNSFMQSKDDDMAYVSAKTAMEQSEPMQESELEAMIRVCVENRWPFRVHATYDETVQRFLNVFERVHRDIPFDGLRFTVDHAETVKERNIERIRALGGGIAVQHRMAFQGEYFVDRYGKEAAKNTPALKNMLALGVPVGGGTGASRLMSANPFMSLYWMISGKTLNGMQLYDDASRLDREAALYVWTKGSSWFSGEDHVKGVLQEGAYADLAVLSDDMMSVEEEKIKSLYAVLTIMGGTIVYADDEFSRLDPPQPPIMPDWAPLNTFGKNKSLPTASQPSVRHHHLHDVAWEQPVTSPSQVKYPFWGARGCSCFSV